MICIHSLFIVKITTSHKIQGVNTGFDWPYSGPRQVFSPSMSEHSG